MPSLPETPRQGIWDQTNGMTVTRRITIWLVLAFLVASGTPSSADDAFGTLAPGLEYRHETRAHGPLSIHVLRIDRRRPWELHTALGQGTIYGLEPLDCIVARAAKRTSAPAMAAINGDFFVIKAGPYQGDPRGLQIVEGELVSRPTGNAFWVTSAGEPKIGFVESKMRVIWPDGKTSVPIGLNEARSDAGIVLYTPTLGLYNHEVASDVVTTRTVNGQELILEGVEAQGLRAGDWLPAMVGQVHEGGGSPLSPRRMILSIGPKAPMPPIKPGDILQLVMDTKPNLCGVRTAVGAGRILMTGGELSDLGPGNQPRHPRSMIGWNAEYLFLIVVDGRQPTLSQGMSYPEMALLVKEYGCTEAVELDGGGSSTLWALGRVLNSPSDGRSRAIANGLILFRPGKD